MRVAVLTVSTGQGHNSASFAIAEYLRMQGVDVHCFDLDALKKGEASVKHTENLYNFMTTRLPYIFCAGYFAGYFISSPHYHSPIYWSNISVAKKLLLKMEEFHPQVIVCPHIFCAQACTYLREKGLLDVKLVGVLTDYSYSPFWEETDLDDYIIASEDILQQLVRKGIPTEKIHSMGIPVQRKFTTRGDKQEAKAALRLPNKDTVLIMGGGMGFGHYDRIVQALVSELPDANLLVVCGKNKSTLSKLQRFANHQNLHLYGFVNNIDQMMDAADVLVTKPGGLTSTEGMVKNIPIVLTRPIPGGEWANTKFFVKRGLAVGASTTGACIHLVKRCLTDAAFREDMLKAQARYAKASAAKDLGDLVIQMALMEDKETVLDEDAQLDFA